MVLNSLNKFITINILIICILTPLLTSSSNSFNILTSKGIVKSEEVGTSVEFILLEDGLFILDKNSDAQLESTIHHLVNGQPTRTTSFRQSDGTVSYPRMLYLENQMFFTVGTDSPGREHLELFEYAADESLLIFSKERQRRGSLPRTDHVMLIDKETKSFIILETNRDSVYKVPIDGSAEIVYQHENRSTNLHQSEINLYNSSSVIVFNSWQLSAIDGTITLYDFVTNQFDSLVINYTANQDLLTVFSIQQSIFAYVVDRTLDQISVLNYEAKSKSWITNKTINLELSSKDADIMVNKANEWPIVYLFTRTSIGNRLEVVDINGEKASGTSIHVTNERDYHYGTQSVIGPWGVMYKDIKNEGSFLLLSEREYDLPQTIDHETGFPLQYLTFLILIPIGGMYFVWVKKRKGKNAQ